MKKNSKIHIKDGEVSAVELLGVMFTPEQNKIVTRILMTTLVIGFILGALIF